MAFSDFKIAAVQQRKNLFYTGDPKMLLSNQMQMNIVVMYGAIVD